MNRALCKRRFANLVKSIGTKSKIGTIAAEANERIAAIHHVDNMTKGKSQEEILNNRKASVKPLVDSFFAWIKTITLQVCLDSGAKKVLLPQTSAVDLGAVPAELMSSFSLVFYQSAEDAVFKALGVE